MFDPDVRCPAGTPIGCTPAGSGCRCGIEHSSICAATDPTSLIDFCLNRAGGYRRCPTWLAEKERIEAQRKAPLVEAEKKIQMPVARREVSA